MNGQQQPVKCWPGCKAEIITPPNVGKRVIVLERDYLAGDFLQMPCWHAMPLQPLASVVIDATGPFLEISALRDACKRMSVPDCILRPLPDDPELAKQDADADSLKGCPV